MTSTTHGRAAAATGYPRVARLLRMVFLLARLVGCGTNPTVMINVDSTGPDGRHNLVAAAAAALQVADVADSSNVTIFSQTGEPDC